jgi:cytochrome b561
MPLSGAAAYYFGVEPAGFVHGGPMKLLLWLVIIAHIVAALVHKFVWKTDVMDRMTKGVKEG